MKKLEPALNTLIEKLHDNIKSMRPTDGFHSPRDIKLVTQVNKKGAVLTKLQEALEIYSTIKD